MTHLQFEALLTTAKQSANRCDFALVTVLGLRGLRIFEATGSNVEDLGEEHGHRVLRVRGKGDKVVLVPRPPAVGRAVERAIDDRTTGPILLTSRGRALDARTGGLFPAVLPCSTPMSFAVVSGLYVTPHPSHSTLEES